MKPETPTQLAPLITRGTLTECRCGSVMLKREYKFHWNSCRSPGTPDIPMTDGQARRQFMAYVEYFYGRNQFIPDTCIP